MLLSVIIITHNRLGLLKRCLDSVFRELPSEVQKIVVLNGEDSETATFLNSYPEIEYLKIDRVSPAQARNQAITHAKGEWIGFLDDDIELPSGYFENLLSLLKLDQFDVIGGPDATAPDASLWENAIGLALTSPLSTSKTRWRHSKDNHAHRITDESNLILCNLWVRKKWMDLKSFPSHYWRNEENVMLHKISKNGARLGWSSRVYVYHKRKNGPKALHIAVSSSGEHRLKSFLDFPETLNINYFIPAIFVAYLYSLIFTAWWCPLMLIPLAIYFLINICTSIYYGKKQWPRVMLIQFLINFSYGHGMWRALTRF